MRKNVLVVEESRRKKELFLIAVEEYDIERIFVLYKSVVIRKEFERILIDIDILESSRFVPHYRDLLDVELAIERSGSEYVRSRGGVLIDLAVALSIGGYLRYFHDGDDE